MFVPLLEVVVAVVVTMVLHLLLPLLLVTTNQLVHR
jgi:hypothetical protein